MASRQAFLKDSGATVGRNGRIRLKTVDGIDVVDHSAARL